MQLPIMITMPVTTFCLHWISMWNGLMSGRYALHEEARRQGIFVGATRLARRGKLGNFRRETCSTLNCSRKAGAGGARTGTPVASFPCDEHVAAAEALSAFLSQLIVAFIRKAVESDAPSVRLVAFTLQATQRVSDITCVTTELTLWLFLL